MDKAELKDRLKEAGVENARVVPFKKRSGEMSYDVYANDRRVSIKADASDAEIDAAIEDLT